MLDFISSIGNIIGENINKLIALIAGKKEEPKPKAPVKVLEESNVMFISGSRPTPWTRKKK